MQYVLHLLIIISVTNLVDELEQGHMVLAELL